MSCEKVVVAGLDFFSKVNEQAALKEPTGWLAVFVFESYTYIVDGLLHAQRSFTDDKLDKKAPLMSSCKIDILERFSKIIYSNR